MYYIINKDSRELIRESRTPFNINEAEQPPDPFIQLKRVNDDTQPAHNAATQKLVREFTDNDAACTRTFQWVIVAKTAEEQAAYAEAQADEVTRQQIKAVYQDLKNGVGTNIERLQRIEKATAWLLRNVVKQ